ncbi:MULTISPECIES: cytochrome P450 [unclassified Ketobacter]|jgi:camphor 5-monooxygenase|uniref:cytochrome P450 n=1 Tax=unclassified Ketobacter TaxID=2639109 RepID=UPI000F0E9712|nr:MULTISPECIES: cytochrome P450 [unclassified Ketobacter]RLT90816.1 MAG: cytochrome P450 [Ketobacter sp. GenoA1]RLT92047.1 MAG: cytochrome P450 [Ketobacter sp.]
MSNSQREVAQDSIKLPAGVSIPSHVPPDRVVDVDIYNIPGAERDLHESWRHIQQSHRYRILWSTANGGHWIATRAAEITAVFADHTHYSSRITIVPRKWGELFPLRPTTLDPPEHRPYRKIMTAALSRKQLQAYEPGIRRIVIETIEAIQDRGQCEFIQDVAARIPNRIFLSMAGIPEQQIVQLPGYGESPNASDIPVMDRYANFLRPWVRSRQSEPGADLLSQLVAGALDGRPLMEDEALELSTAMLTGGIDTVISQLGFIMGFLAQNPLHLQQLVDDRSLIAPAIQEFIRRFPIMTKARLIQSNQELDGVRLKRGDMIVLPPLQGLDDEVFISPMEVDFRRQANVNATFGNGVHLCPGAYLAQLEMEIFLSEWINRIPAFRLQPDSFPKMSSGILGAMLEVKLRW